MARSLKREANTSCIAFRTAASPRTFRKVSCCPAKDASGRSSAVAEERTATAISRPLLILRSSSSTAFSVSGGKGVARIEPGQLGADAVVQATLPQKLTIGVRGGGKAPGDLHTELCQRADHLAEGGV